MFENFEKMFGQWEINDIPVIELPEDAEKAFYSVFNLFAPEIQSQPIVYCGKQVVNGINYMFIYKCTARPSMTIEEPHERISIIKVIINEQSDKYHIVSSEVLVSSTK